MLDARGVQRLLDKTFGMAETAMTVGGKSMEAALRDARLSDAVKAQLIPLYGEEALRRTLNYAGLGLAICRAIEDEVQDPAAQAELDSYRQRLLVIYREAEAAFRREFADSRALVHP